MTQTWNKEHAGNLSAEIIYVVPPTEEQLAKIKSFLQDKYRTEDLTVSLKEDKNLLGGFVIRIGSDEYDWSMRGRLQQIGRTRRCGQHAGYHYPAQDRNRRVGI